MSPPGFVDSPTAKLGDGVGDGAEGESVEGRRLKAVRGLKKLVTAGLAPGARVESDELGDGSRRSGDCSEELILAHPQLPLSQVGRCLLW